MIGEMQGALGVKAAIYATICLGLVAWGIVLLVARLGWSGTCGVLLIVVGWAGYKGLWLRDSEAQKTEVQKAETGRWRR